LLLGQFIATTTYQGPTDEIRIRTPEIVWTVFGKDGGEVTGAQLNVSGQEVPAVYDRKTRSLRATLPGPLESGEHVIQAVVTFDQEYEVSRRWRFRVHAEAVDRVPEPSAGHFEALEWINRFRAELGLEPFTSSPHLAAAAANHAAHMALVGRASHHQEPGTTGFLAVNPGGRARALGWHGLVLENVSGGLSSLSDSLRATFAAPYHRAPFLAPDDASAGVDFREGFLAMLVGMGQQEGFAVSPAAGQANVPTAWNGEETPNPLRVHGFVPPVGFPIVLAGFGDRFLGMRLKSAELTQDGSPVPAGVNHPGNDRHAYEMVILIPREPLLPETTYRVKIDFELRTGEIISRDWTFTTGAPPQPPSPF
jgi:hypothetical protein